MNFVYLVIRSNHHLPYSLLQFRHSPLLHCLTMQVPQAAPLIGWSRLSEFHNSTTGHNNPTKSLNIVPAFTDQFVVTTVNPPITFTASTVSDWEKYTSIGIYTDVASTKVYSGGLVWEPIVPNGAPSPTVTVPVNVIPTAAHMSLNSQDTTEAQHSSKAITTPRAVSTAGATLGKSWNIGPTIVATARTGKSCTVLISIPVKLTMSQETIPWSLSPHQEMLPSHL